MADNDIPKSAIINPIRSLRIPAYCFQLKKCCTILERFIDDIFRGLDFVHGYVDDYLIISPDTKFHLRHMDLVLDYKSTLLL